MRKDKKAKVEDIQATDNLQIDDIQVNEDAGIIQKPKAGEVLKKFFRSLFVSENGNEAKFLTLYKKEGTKSILSSLLCILGGIFIGWIVLLIIALATEDIPTQDAFDGLKILLSGPSTRKTEALRLKSFGNMIFETAPLIMTGLSVAIAFKTGLFNIGAPGQYLMGTMGALLVALGIPTTESTAIGVWLLAIIVGMLFGMIWGLIPGLFKAFLGIIVDSIRLFLNTHSHPSLGNHLLRRVSPEVGVVEVHQQLHAKLRGSFADGHGIFNIAVAAAIAVAVFIKGIVPYANANIVDSVFRKNLINILFDSVVVVVLDSACFKRGYCRSIHTHNKVFGHIFNLFNVK